MSVVLLLWDKNFGCYDNLVSIDRWKFGSILCFNGDIWIYFFSQNCLLSRPLCFICFFILLTLIGCYGD